MAICDFTTPVRRDRSAFASLVLADIETDTSAAPLFIKTGETFDPAPEDLVLRHARRLVTAHFRLGAPVLDNRERLRQFVTFEIGTRDHEVFALILLDSASRFIAYEELFHGTVDGVTVHPRVVLECVLEHKATQVVFTHNHPSGIAEPSHADMLLTERLIKALALIEVRVRDHFIVGASVVSFAERGLIC